MSDNEAPDPFAAFEADRTVIKPSAGRAGAKPGAAPAAPAPSAGAAPAAAAQAMHAPAAASRPGGAQLLEAALPELPAHASLNPLVQVAAPLLSAAPRLRATVRHPNPAALRATLVEACLLYTSDAADE